MSNNNSKSDQKIMKIIGNKYRLIRKIGNGSFGEVYLTVDKEGNQYACKVEAKNKNNMKSRLKDEYNIYKRFASKKLECVPTIYSYIETEDYNLLIMQLLGKSLDILFEDNDDKLDLGTVMKLGVTIISHLEKIHRTGIIHRDIKPNNFMFGIDEHCNDLYIMDFGLSKRWYINNKHIEYRTGRSMIGTARYASQNIHLGSEPSRRDDMESVGYMLLYLVKGSLPWQGLKKKTKENPIDKIGEIKMTIDLKLLCEGLPDCFYEYINYTRNLQFTEKPDYNYLRDLFTCSAKKHDIKLKYYWEKSDDNNFTTINQKDFNEYKHINNGSNINSKDINAKDKNIKNKKNTKKESLNIDDYKIVIGNNDKNKVVIKQTKKKVKESPSKSKKKNTDTSSENKIVIKTSKKNKTKKYKKEDD
jgi:casein kinase 1 alpha